MRVRTTFYYCMETAAFASLQIIDMLKYITKGATTG